MLPVFEDFFRDVKFLYRRMIYVTVDFIEDFIHDVKITLGCPNIVDINSDDSPYAKKVIDGYYSGNTRNTIVSSKLMMCLLTLITFLGLCNEILSVKPFILALLSLLCYTLCVQLISGITLEIRSHKNHNCNCVNKYDNILPCRWSLCIINNIGNFTALYSIFGISLELTDHSMWCWLILVFAAFVLFNPISPITK